MCATHLKRKSDNFINHRNFTIGQSEEFSGVKSPPPSAAVTQALADGKPQNQHSRIYFLTHDTTKIELKIGEVSQSLNSLRSFSLG